ncbi:hypothetical protein MKEN_01427400 [Mycena kentingensis (nom. inval.)]|nr:hypothetical protein MKEN_01427400 [Mycena kentingensis (nom. inval.)]
MVLRAPTRLQKPTSIDPQSSKLRTHSTAVSLSLPPSTPLSDLCHFQEYITRSVDGHAPQPSQSASSSTEAGLRGIDEFKRRLAEATNILPQAPSGAASFTGAMPLLPRPSIQRSLSANSHSPAVVQKPSPPPRVDTSASLPLAHKAPAASRVATIIESLRPSQRLNAAPSRRPSLSVRDVVSLPRKLSKSQGAMAPQRRSEENKDRPRDRDPAFVWTGPIRKRRARSPDGDLESVLERTDSRGSAVSSIVFAQTAVVDHQRRTSREGLRSMTPDVPVSAHRPQRDSTDSDMSSCSLTFAAPQTRSHQRVVDLDVDLDADPGILDPTGNPIYRLQASTTNAVIIPHDLPNDTVFGDQPDSGSDNASETQQLPRSRNKLVRTLGADTADPTRRPAAAPTVPIRRLSISAFAPTSRPSTPGPPLPLDATARRKHSWGSLALASLMPFTPRRDPDDEAGHPRAWQPSSVADATVKSEPPLTRARRRHSIASSVSSAASAPQAHVRARAHEYSDIWLNPSRSARPTPTPIRAAFNPEGPFFDENGYYISGSTFPALFEPSIASGDESEWAGEWNRADYDAVLDGLRRL